MELWSIDPRAKWPRLFCSLVRLHALHMAYGATPERAAREAARIIMRDSCTSPRIAWARMKAALLPIFQAEPETLAALGLALERQTVPGLAAALAAGLARLPISVQEQAILDERDGR